MGIQTIENRIEEIQKSGGKLFIPYVMCGDGGFERTAMLIRLLEGAGASMIEIGIPFSDPIADGPVIQAAGQRALDAGVTLKSIMGFLKTLEPINGVPRIIMTYMNPIVQYGFEAFFGELKAAHVSGVIIPDLPLEEYEMITPYTIPNRIAIIPLVAPSTDMDRITRILDKTSGFIYTVTVNGTTGTRRTFDRGITERLSSIKTHTKMPVVAGFGVSTYEQVRELSDYCDGVVVGSKIVDLAYQGDYEAIEALVRG
ncbi:MAG: tryptophan synthase subunit alpha [Clostridia bacterium]|nr:tryptophan synthase subunit alpha [Clostridia bacterium]